MAERRMFAKTIVDSDAFLDMPLTTQSLYFHLSMRADDDGFINNPKKIQRMIGCSDDDLKLLTAKKFILIFESGVIVIKHWKIHNYIRKDRYNETLYQEEKNQLGEKENKGYSFLEACHSNVNEVGLPNDTQRLPQVRLGKVRLGKVRLGKEEKSHKYSDEHLRLATKLRNNLQDDYNIHVASLDKKVKQGKDDKIPYKQIIEYLNEKTGKKFNYKTESHRKHIRSRYKEGSTLDDFKTVIDLKSTQWIGDDKMEQYLRPPTLFNSDNFDKYLNEKPVKQNKVKSEAPPTLIADEDDY